MLPPLTATEREIAECVAKGWSGPHIGEWLGITEATVSVHLTNIARKLPPYGDLKGYRRVLQWMMTQEAA